jgi:hypothetical protein
VHVAGYHLGLIMRLWAGAGTARELMAGAPAHLMRRPAAETVLTVIFTVATDSKAAMRAISFEPELHD